MPSINYMIISGNLTRDPELKILNTGTQRCGFGIANNRSYLKDGEWINEPNFVNVTIFGKSAEYVAKKIRKGMFVIVEGKLQVRKWVDKNGENKTTSEIIAYKVYPIGEQHPVSDSRESNNSYSNEDIPF